MGKLVNALSDLASNILGGKGPYNHNYGGGYAQARKSAVELRQDNPLSPMDNDPFAFSSISYPQDLANHAQMGHYILFYINVQDQPVFDYSGYKDGESVQLGVEYKMRDKWVVSKTGESAQGDPVYEKSVFQDEVMQKGAKEGRPSYYNGLINEGGGTAIWSGAKNLTKTGRKAKSGMGSYRSTTTRITDSIAIYLPPDVKDNYSVNYNGTTTGMLGFLAATLGGGIGAWKDDDMDKLARLTGDALFGFTDYAFKKAILSSAEFLSSAEGGEEMWNKAFGKADNPYLEVLFESPQLREFTYNFTFAPRNKKERNHVQTIIQMFKFHMAPELRTDHNRFLSLPSTFDIHYMFQGADGISAENDYYNRIATCVLKNCSTDYTPGRVQSHADGSPVQIKMGLTFQETEMITKQHVDEGY